MTDQPPTTTAAEPFLRVEPEPTTVLGPMTADERAADYDDLVLHLAQSGSVPRLYRAIGRPWSALLAEMTAERTEQP